MLYIIIIIIIQIPDPDSMWFCMSCTRHSDYPHCTAELDLSHCPKALSLSAAQYAARIRIKAVWRQSGLWIWIPDPHQIRIQLGPVWRALYQTVKAKHDSTSLILSTRCTHNFKWCVYFCSISQPYDVPPIPLDSESAFIGINSGETKMPEDLIVPKPLASKDVPGTSKPKVRSAASD